MRALDVPCRLTPLEPGVLDHKYYVRGIGNVKEISVNGAVERNVLVAVRG